MSTTDTAAPPPAGGAKAAMPTMPTMPTMSTTTTTTTTAAPATAAPAAPATTARSERRWDVTKLLISVLVPLVFSLLVMLGSSLFSLHTRQAVLEEKVNELQSAVTEMRDDVKVLLQRTAAPW